ncbi:serine hydrolase domain-containing protein [Caulobacter mirabilis]|uniref:serine hydrolase domain-containing protein n=1 Tax=Caulobacter mirabilis TaxID=69666 RepID=UPI001558EE51|nr:serine hydrolase domain-containing protein [Caulobacter mirabilis]
MSALLASLIACACSGEGAVAQEPAPAPAGSAHDQPGVTDAGHAFLKPAGWTLIRRDAVVILEAPEAGSRVALVDARAKDADAAVAEAWGLYQSEVALDPITSVPVANQGGWRDGRRFLYRTTAASARRLSAQAMRSGDRWVVRIEDLTNAVSGKRSADLQTIREGFLPVGHVRESFAGRKAHRLDAARIEKLKRFVETSMKALEVPGVSIGIVQDGQVLFAGGFGVREQGKPAPVDADTLYLIASNTKPLTTLMLAKLVDEEKLAWDTPVVDALPAFALADADTTRKIQVRHLLCACTGLPYRNLDWEFAAADSPATITFDILARMRPTSAFGATYQYSNPIAAAGGYVGGHAARPDLELGRAYDLTMQDRVFGPLGMRRSTFDFDRAMRGNYARLHGVTPLGDLAVVEPARDRQMHAVRPTGGAWSNVDDLLAYVRMELAGGLLPDGRRYISEKALKARWASQISTGRNSWYGMGLDTDISTGTPILSHGGRMYGFRGDVIWLPEHGVGVVILMNASTGNVLMEAFPRKLLEVLFDGQPEADSMVEAAATADRQQRATSRQAVRYPIGETRAAALAPRYRNAFLGDLRVETTGPQTVFDFGAWKAPVAAREQADGTVEYVVMTASSPFPFVAGVSEGRRTLTIRDAQNTYVFAEAD